MTTTVAGAPLVPEPSPVSSNAKLATFPARFVDFWWVDIPAKLRAYSTLLWAAWSDGIYLTAWPRVATVLVFAVFLFGFLEGGTHWRYRTIVGMNGFAGNVLAPMATANNWGGPTGLVFADNLLLLMIAVGLGSLSANLGITLVLGYALGDILWAGPAPANLRFNDVVGVWICRYVPLIVSYLLFFLLASLPILMALELARSSHRRVSESKTMMVALTAIVEAALIYCWGGMAPMVFRTVQLWAGGVPRITVPFYAQVTATWLVPTAVAAVLIRAALVRLGSGNESMTKRTAAAVTRARQTALRTPPWMRVTSAAGVITLLMTGFLDLRKNWAESALFSNFLEGYVVFAGLMVSLLVYIYILPQKRWWQDLTARVEQYPALLRLAAATVASYVLCLALVAVPGLQSTKPGEFGPEVASILVGLGLTLVLLPRGWLGLQTSHRIFPNIRIPATSRAAQAGFIVAVVLLVTKKAFGDCNDCSCCFTGCLPGVAASAAAGGIPGLAGIAGAAGAAGAAAAAGVAGSTTGTAGPSGEGSGLSRDAWVGFGGVAGMVIGGLIGGAATSETGPGAVVGAAEGAGYGKEAGAAVGAFIGGLVAGGAYDSHGSPPPPREDSAQPAPAPTPEPTPPDTGGGGGQGTG